jgi:hypothetical protein
MQRSLILAIAAAIGTITMLRDTATPAPATHQYLFMVFSNPVQGKQSDYEAWYRGQHIHDILQIEGFVAAQFYRLSDLPTKDQPQKYRYLMQWEIRTANLNGVFDRMKERIADGAIVMSPAFDNSPSASVFEPISRRVTAQDIKGKNADQVLALALQP